MLPFKPKWKKAYVYRKPVEDTTEDCFWWDGRVYCPAKRVVVVAPTLALCCCRYINAMEAASANFARNIDREMIRDEKSLVDVLTTTQRHSNSQYIGISFSLDCFLYLIGNVVGKGLLSALRTVAKSKNSSIFPHPVEKNVVFISVFILCGGPNDVVSVKRKLTGQITEETLFILLDVYKWAYTSFCLAFGIRTWTVLWHRLDRLSLQPQLLCQRDVQSSHARCPRDHAATEELHQRVTMDFKWHGELRAKVPVWQRVCRCLTVCWLADKWLCGWIPWRGSALWEGAQREDPQSEKSASAKRVPQRAFKWQPVWKCLFLWSGDNWKKNITMKYLKCFLPLLQLVSVLVTQVWEDTMYLINMVTEMLTSP